MTKRRLPNTDLANICTMPARDQRVALQRKRQFRPPHSLEPTRRNLRTIMGVADALPLEAEKSDKARARSNFVDQLKEKDKVPNGLRFDALWDFRCSAVSECSAQSYGAHRISVESSIRLTDPLLLRIDGQLFVPTSDLRKSGRLVQRARDFVFAMNYHLIIDQDADFAECGLVLLEYWHESDSNHGITPHFFDGTPKYTYDELTEMIAFTYKLWDEILDEQRQREESDGQDVGPLFSIGKAG